MSGYSLRWISRYDLSSPTKKREILSADRSLIPEWHLTPRFPYAKSILMSAIGRNSFIG